jgi:uncharacterized membrane protein
MRDTLLNVRPNVNTMKILALVIATIMVALQLTALDMLTITPLGDGYYQIIAAGNSRSPILPPLPCVLQSSTNLFAWTSISTNVFPYTGDGVTNVVQAKAPMTFYRVISPGPIATGP